MPSPTANWYPDPGDPENSVRYWDGAKWSRETRPKEKRVEQPAAAYREVPQQQQQAQSVQYVEEEQESVVAPLPIIPFDQNAGGYSNDAYAVRDDPYAVQSPVKDEYPVVTAAREEPVAVAESGFPKTTTAPSTPYTVAQLKRQYKAREINRIEFKRLKKEAEKRMSNTRFTSRGGIAFTTYLLSYPALIVLAIIGLGTAISDIGSTLASLNWTLEDAAGSVAKLQSLADLAPEYNAFRQNFIIAVAASSGVPFLLGLFAALKKKGRVWGVATMLLALAFNPAIILFGAPTNLSWWVIAFGV